MVVELAFLLLHPHSKMLAEALIGGGTHLDIPPAQARPQCCMATTSDPRARGLRQIYVACTAACRLDLVHCGQQQQQQQY